MSASTVNPRRGQRGHPGARLVPALVLGLCLLILAGCGRQSLYSRLTEQQANEVEAALLEAGIGARKRELPKDAGFSVEVAQGDVPDAMRVLHERGLPRDLPDTLGKVFEKEGFVSSPLEERARYLYALSQELESTLMSIDGVVLARVHIALPQRDLLSDESESASASVIIVESPGSGLRERETDFKAIVTDGIEGLDDVNRVTVKFFTRGAHAATAAEDEQLSPPAAALSSAMPAPSSSTPLFLALSGLVLLLVVSITLAVGLWMQRTRQTRQHYTAPESADVPSTE